MANTEQKPAERFRVPFVDIKENKDSVTLRAEMPGVDKEEFDVTVDGNELTISGKRTPTDSNMRLIHGESPIGNYRREFVLSDDLDPSRISAKVQHGILTLAIPKKQEVLPKKIQIEA
ncbi:MAG: hypothetical protein Kow0099_10730 [Candidatus Abyssubacteria bacterium]